MQQISKMQCLTSINRQQANANFLSFFLFHMLLLPLHASKLKIQTPKAFNSYSWTDAFCVCVLWPTHPSYWVEQDFLFSFSRRFIHCWWEVMFDCMHIPFPLMNTLCFVSFFNSLYLQECFNEHRAKLLSSKKKRGSLYFSWSPEGFLNVQFVLSLQMSALLLIHLMNLKKRPQARRHQKYWDRNQ